MSLQGKEARQLTWSVCNQGREGIKPTTGIRKSNRAIQKEKESLNVKHMNETKRPKTVRSAAKKIKGRRRKKKHNISKEKGKQEEKILYQRKAKRRMMHFKM
eukprot:8284507-Ditylum_brightwellii.AAC.1